jgi:hypothetical protein
MASQRPHPITERPLDAPLLTFDLAALLAQIKGEDTWQQGPRNAMTLHKGPGLQVVLIAMHTNTTIPFHRADGPISVQVLEWKSPRSYFLINDGPCSRRFGLKPDLHWGVPGRSGFSLIKQFAVCHVKP